MEQENQVCKQLRVQILFHELMQQVHQDSNHAKELLLYPLLRKDRSQENLHLIQSSFK